MKLKNEHGIQADEISKIEIRTSGKMIPEFGEPYELKTSPKVVVDAQFSLPFTVALIFCNGSAMVDDYTEANIADERIRQIARKVKIIPDPEIEKVWPKEEPSEVTVHTEDGRVLTQRVPCAKGSLQNPMTLGDLIEKYRLLAAKSLSDEKISRSVEFFMNLENGKDISKLINGMSAL